ncbi:hypothetical protein ABZP36_011229 [Zizania latifolia]
MGVYTFVCRSSGNEWTAKQLKGELEASAATSYELQRRLVAAASAADSAAGAQSSFAMVTPSSAVFQYVPSVEDTVLGVVVDNNFYSLHPIKCWTRLEMSLAAI